MKKSKVLKLKKKYNRLNWLNKNANLLVLLPLVPGTIMICLALINAINLILTILGLSLFTIGIFNIVLFNGLSLSFSHKRATLNEEIEKLINEDEIEKQILQEHSNIKNEKKESKIKIEESKKLIKKLIEKKNKQAKEHKTLIKFFTEVKDVENKKIAYSLLEKQLKEENIQEQKEEVNTLNV